MNTKQIPLIALALLVSGCKAPVTADGPKASDFTTDVVKKQDLTGYSFFDGKLVIPETAQATAFSPYDTPVVDVMTGAGKHVSRGEPIVKLNIPGADMATSSAKVSISSAKQELYAQKADTAAPVREAQRLLADAQAAEKTARDTVANGGQADVDGAAVDRQNAEAALRQAQQEQRASLQPTKEDVAQASASLQAAKDDAARGIVRAPISGTVVTLDAKPGLAAKAKQSLAMIVNFDRVRVQGLVPPELKDLVAKNSHVIVAMNGVSSAPLEGIVEKVSVAPPTQGQAAPGYVAIIRLLNPQSMAQPSISVKRVGVKAGTVKNVLVVPDGAIISKSGKTFVNVQADGKWVETAVVVGISDGALTEIKSGLVEGATVQIPAQTQTQTQP